MGSSLIENFKYWKYSFRSSRLDANEGSVIQIVKRLALGRGRYEIHPETTEEKVNKMVCVKETYSIKLDELLPSVSGLSEQGTDTVKGIECIKFTNEDQSDKVNEKTLWAYYNNSTGAWTPVRYKTKEIDVWHGYLKNYEIWDYYNFKLDVDQDIFNVTYNCTSKKSYNKGVERQSITKHHVSSKPAELSSTDGGIKMYGGPTSGRTAKVGNIPFPYSETKIKEIAATLPKEYDLRLEGYVGPVLDQQDCTSSWAFAVTAAVEGALARSNGGTWHKLSEQALIDCSWGYGNKGCQGGTSIYSYLWIMEHGLPADQKYGAYTNKNGYCKMENMTKTFKIKGYTNVTPFNIEALKIALIYHGPIVVRVDSLLSRVYDGGVSYEPNCKTSSPYFTYMALVGYGEKDGDTFWILKNSEGPYAGIDGYIHVSARDNNCGVMTEPTYVIA